MNNENGDADQQPRQCRKRGSEEMAPSPTAPGTIGRPPPSTSQSTSSSHRHQRHRRPRTRPVPYLILTNISKRQNVRNLLQIAAAHGCPAVFVVGQKAFEFDPDAKGTDVPPTLHDGMRNGGMEILKFDKLDECVKYVKSLPCESVVDAAGEGERDADASGAKGDAGATERPTPTVPIVGVEIDETSVNLEEEPFATSSVAFMMGNEGSGMTAKQMAACDGFVRISQYGGGTASLNVSVAAGIVLHRFLHWSRGDPTRRYCDA